MELAEDPRAFNGGMFERTSILLKAEGIKNLQACHVFLAGVGGVGGHCIEALVRAGVGNITIVDGDVVSATNKNRQLIALDTTIGQSKVQMMADRITAICQHCRVTALDGFLLPEDMEHFLTRDKYDYVVDCIDSVECKIALLETSVRLGIPVFSSGGAGGRLDPSQVKTGDFFDVKGDALMRVTRAALRKEGVHSFGKISVVYSDEIPLPPLAPQRQENGGRDRAMNGTVSYMPSLFGLVLSSLVIRYAMDPAAAREVIDSHYRKEAKLAKRLAHKQKHAALAKAAATAAAAGGNGTLSGTKRSSGDDGHDTCGGGGDPTSSTAASGPHAKVRRTETAAPVVAGGYVPRQYQSKTANADRKPLAPFKVFSAQARPQMTKDHPEWSPIEVSKALGEVWKGLPEEEKKEKYWTPEFTAQQEGRDNKFTKQAEGSTNSVTVVCEGDSRSSAAVASPPNTSRSQQHQEAAPPVVVSSKCSSGSGGSKNLAPTAKTGGYVPQQYQSKTANADRKPLAPFKVFSAQARPQMTKDHPEWSPIEVSKALGEVWKGLPEEEKKEKYWTPEFTAQQEGRDNKFTKEK